jgi:hypothetical protein
VARHRVIDEAGDVGFAAGIRRDRIGDAAGTADLLRGLVDRARLVDRNDLRAFTRKQQRTIAADAATGAGDDGDLPESLGESLGMTRYRRWLAYGIDEVSPPSTGIAWPLT